MMLLARQCSKAVQRHPGAGDRCAAGAAIGDVDGHLPSLSGRSRRGQPARRWISLAITRRARLRSRCGYGSRAAACRIRRSPSPGRNCAGKALTLHARGAEHLGRPIGSGRILRHGDAPGSSRNGAERVRRPEERMVRDLGRVRAMTHSGRHEQDEETMPNRRTLFGGAAALAQRGRAPPCAAGLPGPSRSRSSSLRPAAPPTSSIAWSPRAWPRYEKPAWGLPTTEIDGKQVKVMEKVAVDKPFCRLIHFERQGLSQAQRPSGPAGRALVGPSCHPASRYRASRCCRGTTST